MYTFLFIFLYFRYTVKAPMCKTAYESSTLFHDIGNCFMMLSNFTYARDSGRKALETAAEANDERLQLQAYILIGITEGWFRTCLMPVSWVADGTVWHNIEQYFCCIGFNVPFNTFKVI